ncbi:MAG TPA: hypothetical protein HPP76_05425 [Desulfuromonadales bacterium]|nr:hypothetical protein [Desulfuromonadales bacterium]
MTAIRKNYKKKSAHRRRVKADRQETLSVVTVRISDEEKERIDEIMARWDIKRYSDVMKIAIKMAVPRQGSA